MKKDCLDSIYKVEDDDGSDERTDGDVGRGRPR